MAPGGLARLGARGVGFSTSPSAHARSRNSFVFSRACARVSRVYSSSYFHEPVIHELVGIVLGEYRVRAGARSRLGVESYIAYARIRAKVFILEGI